MTEPLPPSFGDVTTSRDLSRSTYRAARRNDDYVKSKTRL